MPNPVVEGQSGVLVPDVGTRYLANIWPSSPLNPGDTYATTSGSDTAPVKADCGPDKAPAWKLLMDYGQAKTHEWQAKTYSITASGNFDIYKITVPTGRGDFVGNVPFSLSGSFPRNFTDSRRGDWGWTRFINNGNGTADIEGGSGSNAQVTDPDLPNGLCVRRVSIATIPYQVGSGPPEQVHVYAQVILYGGVLQFDANSFMKQVKATVGIQAGAGDASLPVLKWTSTGDDTPLPDTRSSVGHFTCMDHDIPLRGNPNTNFDLHDLVLTVALSEQFSSP